MLDFVDKTFNQVSFPVKMAVISSARLFAVKTLGNNDFFACSPEFLHKGFRIVFFVSNQAIKNNAFN